MPQMFPMPAIILLFMISVLFFIGIVRVYWWGANCASFYFKSNYYCLSEVPSYFTQTW